MIEEKLETMPAAHVAEIVGVDQTTLKKRARELGYEFDKTKQRWTREAA